MHVAQGCNARLLCVEAMIILNNETNGQPFMLKAARQPTRAAWCRHQQLLEPFCWPLGKINFSLLQACRERFANVSAECVLSSCSRGRTPIDSIRFNRRRWKMETQKHAHQFFSHISLSHGTRLGRQPVRDTSEL